MNNQPVLVVLSNYSRPTNLPACIKAWRGQSVQPASLVIVDNSPTPCDEFLPERYPNPTFEGVDDVWRWRTNLGCPSRFAPALMLYQYHYTIFADDDLIPGSKAIEAALTAANQLDGCFATIGQIGRIVDPSRPSGRRYVSGNCYRSSTGLEIADLTCRCYLVKTASIRYMLGFRHYLWTLCKDSEANADDAHLLDTHDDMLLCFGIQRITGMNSYVLPTTADPQQQLILQNLPEPGAVWRRPTHFQERNQMVDMCLEVGWRPVRYEVDKRSAVD